jgi:hypothetical protein
MRAALAQARDLTAFVSGCAGIVSLVWLASVMSGG